MAHVARSGGGIRVRLTEAAGRIGAVEIVSTRPREAARVFDGKTLRAMCATMGRVFPLCGTARTVAALNAAVAALEIAPDPVVAAARDAAQRAEIPARIVTRLALHWPRVLGLPLKPGAVRRAMAAKRAIAPLIRLPGGACVRVTGAQGWVWARGVRAEGHGRQICAPLADADKRT